MKLYPSVLLQVNNEALFLLGACIALVAFVLPYIFYLITLQNTLKSIHPLHRRVEPGQVWLLLIPFFNIVWQFIVVIRISESIQAELRARGVPSPDKPAYGPGLASCILFLFGFIPVLGSFATIAGLICLIIHWVKVNEYKKQFQAEPFEPNQDSQIFGYGKL